MAGWKVMNPELKSNLIKRKFESLNYIRQFISNYITFIDTGLSALENYKKYKKNNPNFSPSHNMNVDEQLWENKVKPNFIKMKKSAEKSLENAEQGKKSTVRSLAADFRGLSKSMDGIRESFMDILDPKVKEEYLSHWKTTSTEASNIEDTINQWWKDDEILKESITGPIDENELLNYLKPGEKAS